MPAKKPELLAPAGSFMAAWYAFEAGADAVYAGMQRFSARGSAQNFSHLELAKLKTVARERNKKMYVALNTVIREEETDDFVAALAHCERLEVDGILVQDAGALALARDCFPSLAVHASTQMAIGNAFGIAEASRLGIRRIVLPRETSFDEVKAIRARHPDVELEVFIHGALCYSYSGLCLASGLMGGGSGNRGACAQPCRLRFSRDEGTGHFLSCRDLFSGPDARRLADIGVDSLKIEGRLKPASWVYHTVRLYRFILDHPRPEDEPEYRELLERSSFVFTRERTRGRLFGGPDERLITQRYERSVGFPVGRVELTAPDSFSFTALAPIGVGDVLQVFLNEREQSPYKLPVKKMEIDGKKTMSAARGDAVTVESEKIPEVGQAIAKVYARDLELPGVRHDGFKPYRKKLVVNIAFSAQAPGSMRIESDIEGRSLSQSYPCIFDKAEGREDAMRRVRRAFASSENPLFESEAGEILFEGPAASPSRAIGSRQLRNIRDDFLRRAAERLAARDEARRSAIRTAPLTHASAVSIEGIRGFVANRANLNPPIPPRALVPFYLGGRIEVDTIARTGDAVFIPLKPVAGDDEADYYRNIDRFILAHPEFSVFLGVNNLHHLAVVREREGQKNVFTFIDFFFYLANAQAVRFVRRALQRVAFGYFWIEGDETDRVSVERLSGFPLFTAGPPFRPPLFFHKGDLARESLDESPGETDGEKTTMFRHGRYGFEASVKEGFTFVFPSEAGGESPRSR